MFLLFDIGGTKMRFGFSHDGAELGAPEILPTPGTFAEAAAIIQKVSNRLCQDQKIIAVAGGVAGTFNQEHTRLVHAPNLPDWIGQPLESLFAGILDCPIYFENDTALVGLGEAVAGAGRGKGIVAYVTVSTGVGGARIENGVIDKAAAGFEPGHQIIDADQPEKHLEDYISGAAVKRRTGKEPKEIIDPIFWHELAGFLAVGLHNTVLHWSPEIIVLGGSMFKTPGISIQEVRERLEKTLAPFGAMPEIKLAQLGDLGGLHGALHFVRQKTSA